MASVKLKAVNAAGELVHLGTNGSGHLNVVNPEHNTSMITLQSKVDAVTTAVQSITLNGSDIDLNTDGLETILTAVDTAIDLTNTKLTALIEHTDGVETVLVALDTAQDLSNTKLDTVITNTGNVNTNAISIATKVDQLNQANNSKLQDLRADHATGHGKLDTLVSQTANNGGSYTALVNIRDTNLPQIHNDLVTTNGNTGGAYTALVNIRDTNLPQIHTDINRVEENQTDGSQFSKAHSIPYIAKVDWVTNNSLTSSGIITPKLDNKDGYKWALLFTASDHAGYTAYVEESFDNSNWYQRGANLNRYNEQHFINFLSVVSPYFRIKITLGGLGGSSNQSISIKYVRTDN